MDEVDRLATDAAVDALDIYVESVAFRNEDLERLGEIARREGVPLRAHVEQFNANRSVPVALAAGARSVDHLACLHPDDLAPLAAAECAAVLLPGAEFLGAEETAPGRALADAGAICVLATDCNPGTSPVVSLPVVIGLAVRRYGWSAREALAACTLNAAWVLGLSDRIGSIEVGKQADLVVLDTPVEHVPYRFGHNPVRAVIAAGGRVAAPVIAADDLAELLADLIPIGFDEASGTTRLAWTREDEEAAGWFARRAAAIGRRMERDGGGQPVGVPGRARSVVGGRLAPRQRAQRRAVRRRARRRRRVRRGGAVERAAGRDLVRGRGGRALQHADVRLARAGRAARRRRRG